jgi:hypothetical protein
MAQWQDPVDAVCRNFVGSLEMANQEVRDGQTKWRFSEKHRDAKFSESVCLLLCESPDVMYRARARPSDILMC